MFACLLCRNFRDVSKKRAIKAASSLSSSLSSPGGAPLVQHSHLHELTPFWSVLHMLPCRA